MVKEVHCVLSSEQFISVLRHNGGPAVADDMEARKYSRYNQGRFGDAETTSPAKKLKKPAAKKKPKG